MKTIPLTSYNIYEFECDNELTDKVLAAIKQHRIIWTSGKQDNTSHNLAGYLGSNINSIVPYYHQELFNWFDACLEKVSAMHFENTKLTICDSWLTKSTLGQTCFPHSHYSSIFSGLFYLNTHNTAETYFIYEDMVIKNLLGNCGNYSHQKQYLSSPEKNKLLIFPSNLIHGVNINKDPKQLRHTLAFNTFYDGSISTQLNGGLDIKVTSVREKYEAYINKKNNETM